MRKTIIAATAAFAVAIAAAAGTAAATADELDNENIDVEVTITSATTPGTLALSVAVNNTTLGESGSTGAIRQFTGVLPDVTVTDSRTAEEMPDGAANWYVLGSASEFSTDDGATITADHLGWAPRLVDGDDTGDGVISEGLDIDTVLDGDRGLDDQELLYAADWVPAVEGGGSWTASADLFLRVPVAAATGTYSSVITLSLFE